MSRWCRTTTIENERTGVSLTRIVFGGNEKHRVACKCAECLAQDEKDVDEIFERMKRRGLVASGE